MQVCNGRFIIVKIDFEDCLAAAHMERQKIADIYSYDQDFDAILGVKQLEP